jgi:hypothetical protein
LESHIAVIRLKELSNGFRVLSVKAALIESATEDQKKHIRDTILTNQTYLPEMVCCVALFEVEAIDDTKSFSVYEGYGVGPYSDLASIQDVVASLKGRQVELINKLNGEF